MTTKHIDVVFDGPPGHVPPGFIEVENDHSQGVSVGTWLKRPDGYDVLRITKEDFDRVFK